MRHAGVFLALLCACLSGCGGTSEPVRDARQSLTERELTWVRAYSRWAQTFWDDERRRCLEQLDEAGAAPTQRLRPAAADARRACESVAAGDEDEAEWFAESADDVLLALMLENQRLEVRSGVASSRSHVDLELGVIAADISQESVEVRCWSAPDWERYIGESNAWTDDDDDVLEVYANADVDAGRIHLRLQDCNLLVSLEREDLERRTREGLIAAGDALMTFAHEIGHFVDPDASEAEVECGAYESVDRVGAELRLEPVEVKLLVGAYRDEIAPTLPSEYRDSTCPATR